MDNILKMYQRCNVATRNGEDCPCMHARPLLNICLNLFFRWILGLVSEMNMLANKIVCFSIYLFLVIMMSITRFRAAWQQNVINLSCPNKTTKTIIVPVKKKPCPSGWWRRESRPPWPWPRPSPCRTRGPGSRACRHSRLRPAAEVSPALPPSSRTPRAS